MRLIEIYTEGGASLPYDGINSDEITALTDKILAYTETDNVSLSIILTDNKEIHSINREYRGKDTPTDVISFALRDEPFPSPEGLAEELGDVYISLEKTSEQAEEFGVTPGDELKRLLIHGILHLLGYDHERSPDDEKIMQDLEEKILTAID